MVVLAMLPACMVPMEFRESRSIVEDIVDLNQSYFIEGGLSFYPPFLLGLKSRIFNDSVRFRYHYRDQGVFGGVKVSMASADEKTLSFEDMVQRTRKDIDKTNSFRAGITGGTVEDHWQARKREKTIDEMAFAMSIGYKKVAELYPKGEREAVIEDFFKKSLIRQRARYNSIPKDSYQYIKIKGLDCAQEDRYDRLGTPVAQYAQRTGGGIYHARSYSCFVRPKQKFVIFIGMNIASGVELNYDDIIKRTLDSIELDESLPATDTTYSKIKALE
jgi:hypothetical protein